MNERNGKKNQEYMKFTANSMSYCEKMKASLPLYMSERGANTESEANAVCQHTQEKKKITLARE